MEKISFIIPCYCCAMTIRGVLEEMDAAFAGAPETETEVILVNDASPDNGATWNCIKELAKERANVTGIDLARNFGQHAALMAGFRAAGGDILVCLDDDGQTPAAESVKLIEAIRQGADAVYARYLNKQHSTARNFGTALNEWMARVLIGKPKTLYVSSYFAVRRFVANEMMKYDGAYPYVVGLVLRTTKNIVNVDVEHRSRVTGRSGYTFGKLFSLWLNGFTAFSIKPLRVATFTGGVFAFLGFLYGIYTIIKRFVNPEVPLGFSALMCAIVLMGGMIMVMLGLVGEYIGRLYMTGNHSPQYVIRKTTKEVERTDE